MFDKNRKKFDVKIVPMKAILKLEETKNIVCDLIIEIWRLENRFKHLENKLEDNDNKLIREQIERIKNVLNMHNFEVIDYLGENFTEGMSPRKISEEINPDKPVEYRKIKDVIRPEIRYKNKIIFHAEIIVERGTK